MEKAQQLIDLAYSRAKIDKPDYKSSISESDAETIGWFLDAVDDPEKKRQILGRSSMEKWVELGSAEKWISWLKSQFDKADQDAKEALKKELARKEPHGSESHEGKWRLTVRFYSNSHTIKPSELHHWNEGIDLIHLSAAKNKDELDAKFTLPKSIQMSALWDAGWTMAKQFIVALNIGSLGYWWWYVPEHIDRYYTKIEDLESDVTPRILRNPKLAINWGKGMKMEKAEWSRVSLALAMILRTPRTDVHQAPYHHYMIALALMGKSDIHLQFEANIYHEFYLSLKSSLKSSGEWDGKSQYGPSFMQVLSELFPSVEDGEKYLTLGEKLEADNTQTKDITLSEVGVMKLICDRHFLAMYQKQSRELAAKEKTQAQKSN